jgi:hypothetical protein
MLLLTFDVHKNFLMSRLNRLHGLFTRQIFPLIGRFDGDHANHHLSFALSLLKSTFEKSIKRGSEHGLAFQE